MPKAVPAVVRHDTYALVYLTVEGDHTNIVIEKDKITSLVGAETARNAYIVANPSVHKDKLIVVHYYYYVYSGA